MILEGYMSRVLIADQLQSTSGSRGAPVLSVRTFPCQGKQFFSATIGHGSTVYWHGRGIPHQWLGYLGAPGFLVFGFSLASDQLIAWLIIE
eukprot:jgi/Botrbrau1/22546/Bobra.114_2s0069.1